MPFKLNYLLCGVHKEEERSNKKKKNRTNKKKKEKQHTLKPDKSESVVTSPGPDTIDQIILRIPDPDIRERLQQWQTENILEQAGKESKEKEFRRELEERLCESDTEKSELLDIKNEEIDGLNQKLQDVREEFESTKQELQATRGEKCRLESIVRSLQGKPYLPLCRKDPTNSNLVEALGKLVLPLQEKQRQESQFTKEVKDAMRLVENFIGPRWKEFAREIDLPLEIIEDNDMAPDQRQSEIYWRIMSEWQKRENITVTKMATVCQQLGINICLDKPMSGQHKRVLDKNRERVIHDVYPELALNHMLKYLSIPASLREYVTSTEKRYVMAERLLDILPVLGDQAFTVFTLALSNTGQEEIAEQLFENPMPEEHKLVLRKFENTLISYSDSDRLVSGMARYVTIPGCIHGYLLESNTRDNKMRRLLEILPCFGHQALDTLIKALDDTGFKQVASILKDKTGELLKLTKQEASTQVSPEDVYESEELLWKDDYYTREIMTKEMEANAAMFETSIEQQVNMDYRSPKPIEILNNMDMVRVRYTARGTELE
ncbi:uncharacterized protein LOC110456573 [Mizuhopecten yessoensis]|uniref:Death domain-containing protein n=1 Tax=Mizuhopecten yessoensis TaxID=6573 RepID=A0A210QAL7_MIZYE|nr:uncharacterized protein LOC110456573 [Mizuhopecten yessoensis]XP_021363060.1 uncharacterized protein LOC110456573 [Mizuhopecten yessoensis]XP_021363061.1 uncharacterized protein LOC110456573 [Mizuhopecten yessoensis]OWF45777.1 hypothetical protein KP79_PYT13056 [Mizuhopecten yessoensis]